MKKVNLGYVFSVLGIMLGASLALFLGIALVGPCVSDEINLTVSSAITFAIIVWMIVAIGWLVSACKSNAGKKIKRFMDEKSKEAGFENYSTFNSSSGILRIDTDNGRIAYVSKMNPKEFQLVSARDLTNIRSDYKKEVLGGTRYVYFAFTYNGKEIKIPTFASNTSCGVKSSYVLEGLSKADMYAEILREAAGCGE